MHSDAYLWMVISTMVVLCAFSVLQTAQNVYLLPFVRLVSKELFCSTKHAYLAALHVTWRMHS